MADGAGLGHPEPSGPCHVPADPEPEGVRLVEAGGGRVDLALQKLSPMSRGPAPEWVSRTAPSAASTLVRPLRRTTLHVPPPMVTCRCRARGGLFTDRTSPESSPSRLTSRPRLSGSSPGVSGSSSECSCPHTCPISTLPRIRRVLRWNRRTCIRTPVELMGRCGPVVEMDSTECWLQPVRAHESGRLEESDRHRDGPDRKVQPDLEPTCVAGGTAA